MTWQCASYSFDTKMPILMGILNVTPDSFSDGGSYIDPDAAVSHALAMVEEGAAIIDVGGESTRPGAAPVTPEEEWARIESVVRALAGREICVSVDTRNASVARKAVEAGASIINDVSGFRDPAMVEVACSTSAGLVVMHMQGAPGTMQDNPHYDDVIEEVKSYLRDRAAQLEAAGVAHDRICIDPGPGFGKTAEQTLELVRNFHEFVHLGYPVMVAVSRKSYIGKAYGIEKPLDRDEASAQEALMACELGASVVRTHDVAETAKALKNLRPYVLLGLGGNVALTGGPGEERVGKIALLNQAISQLCMLPDSQLIDIASFYASEPAYLEDQDEFINTVVLMRTGIPPRELLDYLHAIENALGRVRTVANGPRTVDLDILDYQLYCGATDDLVLPHPRICERDFVVKPLSEILPGHILADGTPVESVPENERLGRSVRISQSGATA